MNLPVKTSVPLNSKAEHIVPGSYFYDAWKIKAALPELDPLDQFLRVVSSTPKWVDSMMVLRNRIVGLFGLKNLGALSNISSSKTSSDYIIGERVGIFTLIEKDDSEALLGDDDKHLKVVLSVYKTINAENGEVEITVTTIVHVKNWLGRLYMVPVAPAHHIIARRMVKAIGV